MGSNRILYYAQSQSRASQFARASLIDPIESFEEMRKMLRFHPLPVITHRELIPTVSLFLYISTQYL